MGAFVTAGVPGAIWHEAVGSPTLHREHLQLDTELCCPRPQRPLSSLEASTAVHTRGL